MMPTDPTRRSALSVALLAHAGSGYEVDCWLADNGQANGSVRFDTDRAWFTIQGRPAALHGLAEALVRCAELTAKTYPAQARSRRRCRERLGRLPAADLAPAGRLGRPARDPASGHGPGGARVPGRLTVQRPAPAGLGLPAGAGPDRPAVHRSPVQATGSTARPGTTREPASVAEVSIRLGGNLSGDPERRYATGGTAQGRRCTVNSGTVRPRLAAGAAASGRGPAGRRP